MKLTRLIAAAACTTTLAGGARAQDDYHGFDPETVDALNERLETRLTPNVLEAMSQSTSIDACGGPQETEMNPPEGWNERLDSANRPGGETPMPVPTSGLAVEYPPLYEVLGVESACEVMFDVTENGATENLLANCSMPGFGVAAQDIFTDLTFTPAEGQDSPAITNVIVPVHFCRPDEEDSGEKG